MNNLKINNVIKAGVFFVTCYFMSINISACEFHDSSNPNFGVFGHYMTSEHFEPVPTKPKLELTLPQSVVLEGTQEKSIRLRYFQPNIYKDVEVSFYPTEAVTLITEKTLPLNKRFGAIELILQAKEKGEHKVKIAINGFQGGNPYLSEQTLTVIR